MKLVSGCMTWLYSLPSLLSGEYLSSLRGIIGFCCVCTLTSVVHNEHGGDIGFSPVIVRRCGFCWFDFQ